MDINAAKRTHAADTSFATFAIGVISGETKSTTASRTVFKSSRVIT